MLFTILFGIANGFQNTFNNEFNGDANNSIFIYSGRTSKAVEGYQTGRSCLLYTSPSPRDRTRSRMPSSA